MDGNRLILTAIPPKTTYPVKVTVIAWQYGKNSDPKIKTAEPVKANILYSVTLNLNGRGG